MGVIVIKPDDLSSIPGTHMVENTPSQKLSSDHHLVAPNVCTCPGGGGDGGGGSEPKAIREKKI